MSISMTQLVLFALAPLAASASAFAAAVPVEARGAVSLVRLPFVPDFQLQQLAEFGVDFAADHPRPGGPVEVLVDEDQRDWLAQRGFEGETLIADAQRYFDTVINHDEEMGVYHSYDEMVAELRAAATEHSEILRVVNLGPTWETLNQGADRYIWAVKISDDPDYEDPSEPEVLAIGNTHSREVATVEIPLAFIAELTDGYGNDPQITEWVDERQIWFIPMVNPDGHNTVANSNAMWRKNRNRNGSAFALAWGIDLNRNWSYKWGYDNIGSSPVKFMETYRGTGPFSEPEAEAIDVFVREHRFALSTSYHSYGNLFLYTWSYARLDTPDHSLHVALGEEATRLNGYLDGNPKSGAIYTANGEWDDYMYGERSGGKAKTFAFTAEVGNAFWPSESLIGKLVDENRHAFQLFLELADYPWRILGNQLDVSGVAESASPGEMLRVEAKVENLLPRAATYQVWLSAETGGEVVREPLAGVRRVSLDAGASETVSWDLTVPSRTPPGAYELAVELGPTVGDHVGQVLTPVRIE